MRRIGVTPHVAQNTARSGWAARELKSTGNQPLAWGNVLGDGVVPRGDSSGQKPCPTAGMDIPRQLRLRGVLTPGKHYRRWGCTQGRGPLQWHLENVEARITAWSKKNLGR
jgi:hypothetical protein